MDVLRRLTFNISTAPTARIGDDVFVGSGARILGPVVVGDNCMIGANAVVVKDIPKDSVAVGVPAKVVKKVDEPYNLVEKRIKKSLMGR